MIPRIKMNLGEAEIVDIPTMRKLLDEEYRLFIRDDGLVFIDHHDVLRCSMCACPLATTLEQMDILMKEPQRLRPNTSHRRTETYATIHYTDKPAAREPRKTRKDQTATWRHDRYVP